ncbi:MAG: hypothetical protein KAX05_02025 [Bacteroidales bacterium]|nr:hypothetical protein [Bacteroidales bacterium]
MTLGKAKDKRKKIEVEKPGARNSGNSSSRRQDWNNGMLDDWVRPASVWRTWQSL